MKKERILNRISQLHWQLGHVTDRMYVPHIETSEYRELCKKEKKLKKNIDKLKKKLSNGNE